MLCSHACSALEEGTRFTSVLGGGSFGASEAVNEQLVIGAFQRIAETLRATQAAQADSVANVARQFAQQGVAMQGFVVQNVK